jgi:hypothetical protein
MDRWWAWPDLGASVAAGEGVIRWLLEPQAVAEPIAYDEAAVDQHVRCASTAGPRAWAASSARV